MKFNIFSPDETEAIVHALQHHLQEKQYCLYRRRTKSSGYKQKTLKKWEEKRRISFKKIEEFVLSKNWKNVYSFEEYDSTVKNNKRKTKIKCLKCGNKILIDCSNYKNLDYECQSCVYISRGWNPRDGKYSAEGLKEKIGSGWKYISGAWNNGKHSIITAMCDNGHISSKEFRMYKDNNCKACADSKRLQKMIESNTVQTSRDKKYLIQRKNALIKAYKIVADVYKENTVTTEKEFLDKYLNISVRPCKGIVKVKIDNSIVSIKPVKCK